MAYSRSNLAYDLSAYESVPKAKPKQKKKVELKVVRSKKQLLSAAFSPRVLSSFAIVVTLLCLMVYNQVRLTELGGEINRLNNQLNLMESESLQMQTQLESTISLHVVEEMAKTELGMQRLDKYQTEYIYLFEEDKIEVTEAAPKDGFFQQTRYTVNAAFTRMKEYLTGF